MPGPTKCGEWVKAGDKCVAALHSNKPNAMVGTVLKVVPIPSLPVAVVKWSNGSIGRHTITTLKRKAS